MRVIYAECILKALTWCALCATGKAKPSCVMMTGLRKCRFECRQDTDVHDGLCDGLADMNFFTFLKSSVWAYPILEVMHIFGIGLLLGNLVLLEMRVFGRGAQLDAKALASLSLGIAGVGFLVAALTGLLMFASQAAELLVNRAFTFKMILLILAGCNAAWFHGRASLEKLDSTARCQMLLSGFIWLAVVACGRWIAYI